MSSRLISDSYFTAYQLLNSALSDSGPLLIEIEPLVEE